LRALQDENAQLKADLDAAVAKNEQLQAKLDEEVADRTNDHPVHEVFAQIEAELARPTGILVKEIHNLLNRGRALF
jgi:multidrug resistance efflux pump